jgi:hypothetical protein
MIKTTVFLNNIKADLKAQTWTSPTSSKVVSFKDVVDYPNWTQDKGYPYMVVLDKPQGGDMTAGDSRYMENTTNFEFNICVNYKAVSGATIDAKRSEAMRVLREAYDFIKGYIYKDSTIKKWLTTPTIAYTDMVEESNWRENENTYEDLDIGELNLFVRRINLQIKDLVIIQ